MRFESPEFSVSVCMASYNGASYIREQIQSILRQLSPHDEVIVVDDCSTDDTLRCLEAFRDARIVVYRNERNRGHVFTFQRAIELAQHPTILLADQDDRWLAKRVDTLMSALQRSGALVVSSNSDYMNAEGAAIGSDIHRLSVLESRQHLRNILRIFVGRSGYFGCAMAFRKEIVWLILPVPRFVESHDLWIALASNLLGSNVHVEASTVTRRLHGQNASLRRRSLYQKLRSRAIFALSIVILLARYLCRKRPVRTE